ncbi:MAG TPA: flagellar basal body rod protein FlgC [Firmicutes bacterium]|nr:flagellar basal body rod protein FlgC [Bacillota bacterium]
MNVFKAFRISASGLTAERLRMDTIANNLANANTTRSLDGGPYRRQVPVFAPLLDRSLRAAVHPLRKGAQTQGVQVLGIISDPAPPRMVYDPQHPDADADGYVAMPNVHVVKEMVDLITATRAYEANVEALNAARSMAQKALEIGR